MQTEDFEPANASREDELSVLLLEEKQRTLELGEKIAALNRQLAIATKQKLDSETEYTNFKIELIEKTNTQLAKSSEETNALREEIEQLSAALFTEANLQVETAKKSQWDVKQLNDKLSETLQTKDNTIEVLQAELDQFKSIITNLQSQLDDSSINNHTSHDSPSETLFDIPSLDKYNNMEISHHTFNQLRLDSSFAITFKQSLATNSPDTWSIRSTKVFEYILTEIESCVRLDKAPAFRYKFNKRSLLLNLLDYKAGIEPLSASTEAWKKFQLDSNNPSSPSIGTSTIKTPRPLAIHDPCSLCGDKKDNINHSRLYKMTIFKKEKEIYNLCINCASKWRVVIPLMNALNNLKPTTDYRPVKMDSGEMFIPSLVELYDQYFQIIPYLISLTYLRLGVWEDGDVCGLVYGWKNNWLGKFIPKTPTLESNSSSETSKQGTIEKTEERQEENEQEQELEEQEQKEDKTITMEPLSNPKQSNNSGIDLRVVSATKRLSVNLNLLIGNQPEKEHVEQVEPVEPGEPVEKEEEEEEEEEEVYEEAQQGDSYENSNKENTSSID